MIPKFPKYLANQTVTFEKFIGREGPYKEPKYEKPIVINNCVFQPQTVFSGTNNNQEVTANAILFLYAGVSNPIPTLSKDNYQSKVTFEGHEYIVKSIVDNRDPYSNEVWSYELEVL